MNPGQTSHAMTIEPPDDAAEVPVRGGSDLAETVLEFGEPILKILPAEADQQAVREALELTISIWNAHALASPAWGSPEMLSQIEAVASSADSPQFLRRTLSVLAERKQAHFAGDARLLGSWQLEEEASGYVLHCESEHPERH